MAATCAGAACAGAAEVAGLAGAGLALSFFLLALAGAGAEAKLGALPAAARENTPPTKEI